MSHAAFIALMHNQSLAFNYTEMFESLKVFPEEVTKNLIIILSDLIIFLAELLQYVAEKYAATFGDNYWLSVLIFSVGFYVVETIVKTRHYVDRLKEVEDQIQYIKKKEVIKEGNIEFLFDHYANNELKLIKLTKQMKKLQKEVNTYA
jgi:hypothetical protein